MHGTDIMQKLAGVDKDGVTLMSTLSVTEPKALKMNEKGGFRFLMRRPIFDGELNTFGQEILFGNGREACFTGHLDDSASQVIDSLLTSGAGSILSDGKIFVICTRSALLQGLATLLPADLTVLGIPSAIEVNEEVFAACKELRELGYELALEDYSPRADADRLLPLASYLKLDFRTCDAHTVGKVEKDYGRGGLSFVAKGIETQEEFAAAQAAGYRYFEGYFFAHPTLMERRELPPNKALYLQLLGAVNRSPLDRMEVEKLVMAEASLCFRLLRLVSSAGLGIRNPIRTVRQAMLMIGDDELSKLIMVSGAALLAGDLKAASEILLMSQYRARFCELLAAPAGQEPGEQYLIGLLSVIESLLQIPMSQALALLPLRSEAKAALRGVHGPVAIPLRLLEAYEQQNVDLCNHLRGSIQVSQERLEDYYLASLRWGARQSREMRP